MLTSQVFCSVQPPRVHCAQLTLADHQLPAKSKGSRTNKDGQRRKSDGRVSPNSMITGRPRPENEGVRRCWCHWCQCYWCWCPGEPVQLPRARPRRRRRQSIGGLVSTRLPLAAKTTTLIRQVLWINGERSPYMSFHKIKDQLRK